MYHTQPASLFADWRDLTTKHTDFLLTTDLCVQRRETMMARFKRQALLVG